MDRPVILLLLAIAVAGVAFFVVSYVLSLVELRKIRGSRLETKRLDDIEGEEAAARRPVRERVRGPLADAGWNGGMGPVLVAGAFLYAVCVLVLSAIGVPDLVGLALGLPASFGAATLAAMRIGARRQILFQRQLMFALSDIAARLQGGAGAKRALDQVVPNLENPLGAELEQALDSTQGQSLVDALQKVEERYPSRAFTLFITALEIDEKQGGQLAPALREASAMLQRQFELAEEAQAELAQAKMEFFVVAAIVGLIVVTMFTGSDDATRSVYFSFIGLIAVGFGFGNAAIGFLRAFRLFAKAREGQA
jgi:Flp pilus assembly protein TadB